MTGKTSVAQKSVTQSVAKKPNTGAGSRVPTAAYNAYVEALAGQLLHPKTSFKAHPTIKKAAVVSSAGKAGGR